MISKQPISPAAWSFQCFKNILRSTEEDTRSEVLNFNFNRWSSDSAGVPNRHLGFGWMRFSLHLSPYLDNVKITDTWKKPAKKKKIARFVKSTKMSSDWKAQLFHGYNCSESKAQKSNIKPFQSPEWGPHKTTWKRNGDDSINMWVGALLCIWASVFHIRVHKHTPCSKHFSKCTNAEEASNFILES